MAETKSEWFDRLYEQYMPFMRKLARRKTGSIEVAEDMVQEVFVQLLMDEEKVRRYEHPEGWLFITLKYKIGNYLQRAAYRDTVSLDAQDNTYTEDVYHFPLSDSLPEGLAQKDRNILELFYEQELTYEEIARRFHCSVTTCRTQMCRAKARCRKLLQREGTLL